MVVVVESRRGSEGGGEGTPNNECRECGSVGVEGVWEYIISQEGMGE